ncbi:MAG: copper amine oxidase N-terminal domain-containing protein [Oscillospiraceae bacterium]
MKFKVLASTVALSAVMASTAFAAQDIGVFVNNTKITTDVAPVIVNGSTLVPVRTISDALNASTSWDDPSKTATISIDNKVIKVTINSTSMYINDSKVPVTQPAQIINGRTMVPLRAISEAFSAEVNWNGDTRTISISTTATPTTEPKPDITPTVPEQPIASKSTEAATSKLYNAYKSERYNFENKYNDIIKDRRDEKENGMSFAKSKYNELVQSTIERAYDYWIEGAEKERDLIYSLLNTKYGVLQSSNVTSRATEKDFVAAIDKEFINPTSEKYLELEKILDLKSKHIALVPNFTPEQQKANKEAFDKAEKEVKTELNNQKIQFSTMFLPNGLIIHLSDSANERIDTLKKIYYQDN